MGQLQAQNPQKASQISQAMNSGANPNDLLKQMFGNSNNGQVERVMQQAKNMGVPNEILNQIQNFK